MKHLLVIRLSALGDAAILAPVLKTMVGGQRPVATKITVAAPPLLQPLFDDIPGVNFLGVEKRQSAVKLYRIFRSIGADTVADLHHVNRVNRALFLLQIDALMHFRRLSIHHIRKGRLSRLLFLHHRSRRPRRPQAERYLDVLKKCINLPSTPPTADLRPPTSTPLTIGIAPFAQHKGKVWPFECTAELVRLLTAENYRVILFGSKAEAPQLESLSSEQCQLAEGGFKAQLDTIRNLTLMVTMDSANMHFASAVGTPVVSIWGATHPDFGFYGWGQDRANALCADLPCQPCSAFGQHPCRFGDYRCLRAITPLQVFQHIKRIVNP